MTTVHITDIRNGGVYGHEVKHCDESGCAGDEMFWRSISPEDVSVGDAYVMTSIYTYTNSFHQTEFKSRKDPFEIERLRYIAAGGHPDDPEYKAARAYVRKMWRHLCGIEGCTCADECGRRWTGPT